MPELFRVLSLPVITSMAALGVFQIADALFIGALGTAALGAVSVAFPLFTVVGGIGQAFGTGAASLVSRLLGARRRKRAGAVASFALFGAPGTALVVAFAVTPFVEPLLAALGGTPSIVAVAAPYVRILLLANVLTVVNVTMVNLFRAEGDARRGMISVLVSSGLNIVLDPVLIFGFGLGMPGAAVATLIAQSAATVYLACSWGGAHRLWRVSLSGALSGRRMAGSVVATGAPGFFLLLLGAAALAMFNHVARGFGDAAVASVGLAFRVVSVGILPVYGLTTGLQPVVGYNFGLRAFGRVRRAVLAAAKWSLLYTVPFAAAVVATAPVLVSFFSDDPEVLRISARMVRAIVPLFPLFGLQIVFAVVLQALGRVLQAALVVISRQVVFLFPAVLFFPRVLGLDGILLAQPTADLLTSLLTAVFAICLFKDLGSGAVVPDTVRPTVSTPWKPFSRRRRHLSTD